MDKQAIDGNIFSQSELLRDIPESQASEILNTGIRKTLQKDEILFHQGDLAAKCYFLLSGRIKLTKLHEEGREAVIRYITPGGLTAAGVVLKGNQYPVTAKSLWLTTLIGWDKNTMLSVMHQYPQISVSCL